MLTRRGFLWLCGGSSAGIFLAGGGLFQLPRRMVLQLSGFCSFCGKNRREVFGMAGVVGREPRICDECIGLCNDILAEESFVPPPAPRPATPREPKVDELEALLRNVLARSESDLDEEAFLAQMRDHLTRSADRPVAPRDFSCSFCDRERQDVNKLISGPRVFICDDCAWDANGLLGTSGWRSGT